MVCAKLIRVYTNLGAHLIGLHESRGTFNWFTRNVALVVLSKVLSIYVCMN